MNITNFRLTSKRYLILGVGLEPCNYIRGFILLEYTLKLNNF